MKITSFNKITGGLITIELLISFAILIIHTTGIVLLWRSNQSFYLDSKISQEALRINQTAIEQIKHDSRIDFNLLNPTSQIDGIYQKIIQVSPIPYNFFLKKVESIITWNTAFHENNIIKLTTLIANLDAIRGGDTCSSVLSGDWSHPIKTEYEFGKDVLNDTSSGFPISSIQTWNGIMYATVASGNTNTSNNFFRLNISLPELPTLIPPGLDNNPAVTSGLNAVAVDGDNYAYVASAYSANFNTCVNTDGNNKSCGQLQVIDLDTFSVVYTYKIPNVSGSAGQAIGVSILYKNGIVYLGLAKATGPEFNIIDVGGGNFSGSPTHPILIGSYEIGNEVNEMYIKDNYIYIASPNDQELKILDISNPNNPILVGGFNAPGGGANNGNGKSLHKVGNNIYFGRTLLSGNEFYILDASNVNIDLPILGTKNIQNGNANASVNKIFTRDYLSMLLTNKEFQIFRTDNPANIISYTSPIILPPGASVGMKAEALDCEGNYIFIGSAGPDNIGFMSVITAI